MGKRRGKSGILAKFGRVLSTEAKQWPLFFTKCGILPLSTACQGCIGGREQKFLCACVYTCMCRHIHTFLHTSVYRCTFASLFHYASCISGTFEFWCLCVHSHLCVKQGQATGWHGTIDRGSENGSSVAVVIGILDIVICCAWSCHYSGGVCHYECMYTSYVCAACVCCISCPTIHIRHAP